jgi:hypothetical protein
MLYSINLQVNKIILRFHLFSAGMIIIQNIFSYVQTQKWVRINLLLGIHNTRVSQIKYIYIYVNAKNKIEANKNTTSL